MSLEQVKQLRELTGAGFNDCQNALKEANGEVNVAVDLLRKMGQLKAVKKGERTTNEGMIGVYVHSNNKVAAMVELLCETDFVARNDDFRELAHDLAMQVVAGNARYLTREEVPADEINHEKEIYLEQLKNEGKPEAVIEKIITGKLDKYFEEICLMEQIFVKNDQLKIKDLLTQYIQKIGENLVIKRFVRYQI